MSNVDVAGLYARTMVGREMAGPNDLNPAMQRISNRHEIPFWSLDHLRRGKAKTIEASLFYKIRAAYFAHCERQLKALQHELSLEKETGNVANLDLLAEVEALLAKAEKRHGGGL